MPMVTITVGFSCLSVLSVAIVVSGQDLVSTPSHLSNFFKRHLPKRDLGVSDPYREGRLVHPFPPPPPPLHTSKLE